MTHMLDMHQVSKTHGSGATEVHALKEGLHGRPWRAGRDHGPSGSGKSTFGDDRRQS
jgi:ABC-type lipoprotein export system ATPase subunit